MILTIGFLTMFNLFGNGGIDSADVSKFDSLRLTGNYIILDVRTKSEFDEGHIENAILVDIHESSFQSKINELDKEAKYLVYCRSGNRSRTACKFMNSEGFKTAINLSGGINAWKALGKEIKY